MEQTKQELRKFEGAYKVQMPELIKAGFKPLTIAEIMQAKLNSNLSFDEYYDSASAIAYLKDEFKIIPYSKELADVNPNTPLYNGGIKLTPKEYQAITAKEFSRKDMPLRERLTQEQVLQHLGWLELAGDKTLLEQYTEEIFKRVKNKYGEDKAMGFYITDNSDVDVPNLCAFYLFGLDGGSDADDRDYLDGDARLVGVCESAESTAQENLEVSVLKK